MIFNAVVINVLLTQNYGIKYAQFSDGSVTFSRSYKQKLGVIIFLQLLLVSIDCAVMIAHGWVYIY